MRYVIIRDDDTNAFTPIECLERLYRPFLDRGLPVNLATIPSVATDARREDGQPEGFLIGRHSNLLGNPRDRDRQDNRQSLQCPPGAPAARALTSSYAFAGEDDGVPRAAHTADCPVETISSALDQPRERAPSASPMFHQRVLQQEFPESVPEGPQVQTPTNRTVEPMGANCPLVAYLQNNPGYHILQHGCHHEYLEFDSTDRAQIIHRLELGSRLLEEAGFRRPQTFVAPYDRLSTVSFREVAARFRLLSTGWFELGRLPCSWWGRYALKRLCHTPHWRAGRTLLLSHPGCLLSCHREYATMLNGILQRVQKQRLTILVTHWWEYFRNGQPDEPFIELLHETARCLATREEIKVVSFDDLLSGGIPLN